MKLKHILFILSASPQLSFGQIDSSLFSAKVLFNTGSSPNSLPHTLASADIDGDGKADIVVPNSGSNTISVFRNIHITGRSFDTTSFATKIDLPTLANPLDVKITDLDNDGKQDLVIGYYTASNISIYPGN